MKKIEIWAGTTISEAAEKLVFLANRSKRKYQTDFNGICLIGKPNRKTKDIIRYYWTESHRRAEAYYNSQEYKDEVRIAEEETRKSLLLQGALSIAPEKMTVNNQEEWQDYIDKNKDPYGAAIIRFAELWARLMETRIQNGESIKDCAEELSELANDEGITGFMYGCAVNTLSRVWIHGEELRQWHNLKTQIGNEGEKANKTGGVLNPAILNIS